MPVNSIYWMRADYFSFLFLAFFLFVWPAMPHATIHHATEAFKERLWLCRSNNFPFRLLWYATYKKFFILAFCVRLSAQLSMDMWKRMKVINSTRKTDMYCKKLIFEPIIPSYWTGREEKSMSIQRCSDHWLAFNFRHDQKYISKP